MDDFNFVVGRITELGAKINSDKACHQIVKLTNKKLQEENQKLQKLINIVYQCLLEGDVDNAKHQIERWRDR